MATIIDDDAITQGETELGFSHPAIIRCSSNLMFVGHINSSNELEIHKSTDGGETWTLNHTFTDLGGYNSFCLVPIDSTTAGVVYTSDSTHWKFYKTSDSGTSWVLKKEVSDQGYSIDKVLVSYNVNTNKLCIFHHRRTSFLIRCFYSSDKGESFNSTYLSSPTPHFLYDIDKIETGDVTFYMLFSSDSSKANLIVKEFKSTYFGNSIYTFSESGYIYHNAQIVIDSGGNKYIIYIKRNTSTLKEQLIVRKNGGSEIVLYDPDTSHIIVNGSISIACDNDNNIYVYYTKKTDEKTYYRKYNSGTDIWESEVKFIDVINNRINTEKHVLAGSSRVNYIFYKQS